MVQVQSPEVAKIISELVQLLGLGTLAFLIIFCELERNDAKEGNW